jgi:hypothetical protein
MKARIFIIVFSVVLILFSCKQDKDCTEYQFSPVIQVEGPEVCGINERITLKVFSSCYNSCGQFDYFKEDVSGRTITIEVYAVYKGCICADVNTTIHHDYVFETEQMGTYKIKFAQGNDQYLIHTIEVSF